MRKTPAALALVAVAALFTVAGCSAPTPTPTPAIHLTPTVFSGSADGAKTIIVPKGAHSASITVVCGSEGYFTLDGALNKNESGLNGGCASGAHRYELAAAPGETLDLHIQTTKNARFVVETRFASNHFMADTELAAQCSAMIDVGSDVFNAEDGFTRGALTLAQWKKKVSDASSALEPALAGKTNILTATLTTIDGSLGAHSIAPGAFEGTSDYTGAMSIVTQVCADNGDEVYVNAQYGG